MTMNKSNVIIKSNIYPRAGELKKDNLFISNIRGRDRLNEVVEKVNLDPLTELTYFQRQILNNELRGCSNRKEESYPWGMVWKGRKIEWICRCENYSCNTFHMCRFELSNDDIEKIKQKQKDEYLPTLSSLYNEQSNTNLIETYNENKNTKINLDNEMNNSAQGESTILITINNKITNYDYHKEGKPEILIDQNISFDTNVAVDAEDDEDDETIYLEEIINYPANIETEKTVDKGVSSVNSSLDNQTDDEFERVYNEIFNEEDNFKIDTAIQEQGFVIEAGCNEKILVNAGPGTGKTYALIEKLKYLVNKCGINPKEIMILCFSKAAVAEILKRIDTAIVSGIVGYELKGIEIRTFDSFATFMLSLINKAKEEVGEAIIDFTKLNYDERIILATQQITHYPDMFSEISHFIVDEIQDLVRERAKLIQSILKNSSCGFTLLGDFCQAIYDYQVKDRIKEINSTKFYKWLTIRYSTDLHKVEFIGNHRQTADLANMSDTFRYSLLNNTPSESKSKFTDIFGRIESIGECHTLGKSYFAKGKSVCLLCTTNGEALKASSYLRNQNIEHSIQRQSTVNTMDSWLGQVFGEWEKNVIDFDDFRERFNYIFNSSVIKEIELKWQQIKDVEGGNSSKISIPTLLRNIFLDKNARNSFYTMPEDNVVVSTIHKAKGREYDNVIIIDEWVKQFINKEKMESTDTINSLKTYYVALTRPKINVFKTGFKKAYLHKLKVFDERWYETGYNPLKGKKYLTHIEIGMENDIEQSSFVDINLHENSEKAIENQLYIRKIKKGDVISLRKVIDSEFYKGIRYDIYHNDAKLLGTMSSKFVISLELILKTLIQKNNPNLIIRSVYPDVFPKIIDDIYVESVNTYISRENDMQVDEIHRNTQIWNTVSVVGFGKIVRDEFDF